MSEEKRVPEEQPISGGGERREPAQHVVGELSLEEKQQLFLKKLYRLSQTHIDETPEEDRTPQKPRAVASLVFSQPTTLVEEHTTAPTRDHRESPPASPLRSFASRLSEMASCGAMEFLCSPRDKNYIKKEATTKKKSPLLHLHEDNRIPETIILEPSNVSRLDDDDSLARHINNIARRQKATPPPFVDVASANSPQCVAEMALEMEISRIIPPETQPAVRKTKRRGISGNRAINNRSTYELEADEMEF